MKKPTKEEIGKIIQYVSTGVMFLIVLVWIMALLFAAIIVWREPTMLDSFTNLASIVTGTAVIGYFGRIALTHYQTLKATGKPVPNDFCSEEIVMDDPEGAESEGENGL